MNLRKIIVPLFAIMALWSGFSFVPGEEMLPIGVKAPRPDHKMQNIDGEQLSLQDLKRENGLLVIFTCNTCPFVLAWEDQYPKLGEMTAENKIGMVLVNSNASKRGTVDSREAMENHYGQAGYNVPYVLDENSTLANVFGARTTPHVYLFDSEMKLRYRGSINDKYENKDKEARTFYLENALKNIVKGEKIKPATTKEIGCSIKRTKV